MFLLESFQVLQLGCTRGTSGLCGCHAGTGNNTGFNSMVVLQILVGESAE